MAKILKILGNDPNSPLTLRSLIDPKRAWIIIGPQGSSHKSLQIRHGVYITLHSTFDEPVGRLCSVTGTALSVSRAYKEIILMLFEKRRSNPPLTRAWINLLIATELFAKLQEIPATTGDGCILNDISRQTNTRISIEPIPLVNTTEHVMKISAAISNHYLEEMEQALVLITHQYQIHRHETLSPNNIYYLPFPDNQSETYDGDDDDIDIEHEHGNDASSIVQHQQSPTLAKADDSCSIDLAHSDSYKLNTSPTSSDPSPSLSALLSTTSDVD